MSGNIILSDMDETITPPRKQIPGSWKINKIPWFVGDNVGSDGNDKEIFKILVESNRGFKASGPEETVEIISTILERIKSDG